MPPGIRDWIDSYRCLCASFNVSVQFLHHFLRVGLTIRLVLAFLLAFIFLHVGRFVLRERVEPLVTELSQDVRPLLHLLQLLHRLLQKKGCDVSYYSL